MTRTVFVSALAAAALAAGCGGSGGDAPNKAGAAKSTQQVLHLQAPDPGDPETLYLAQKIRQRSGGSLRVEIENDYSSVLAANEVRLARALRKGDEGFGLLPARAWPAAGVPAFAALHAPFVIGNQDVARAAMQGPAGRALDDALHEVGLVPLGLVATQPRRVLSTRPLDTPEDFHAARLRILDSDTTALSIEALGAKPVQGMSGDDVKSAFRAGRIEGAETAPRYVLSNNYGAVARHLSGYSLFNKVQTFVAAPAAWEKLSAEQQKAVRAAAADTAVFAATQVRAEERQVAMLCRQGVRVDVPTAAALQALAAATERVRARLERDPAAAPVLRLLQATPGAGPIALTPPAACAGAGSADDKPERVATIPAGTYAVTVTEEDYQRAGAYDENFQQSIEITTKFDGAGHVTAVQVPDWEPECVPCRGTYDIEGDRITFRWHGGDGSPIAPETMRWSFHNGLLTFTDVEAADAPGQAWYESHPWRKVH
jgi:TRAP-type transport system periplasmic protein